jgi:hypothetical protein
VHLRGCKMSPANFCRFVCGSNSTVNCWIQSGRRPLPWTQLNCHYMLGPIGGYTFRAELGKTHHTLLMHILAPKLPQASRCVLTLKVHIVQHNWSRLMLYQNISFTCQAIDDKYVWLSSYSTTSLNCTTHTQ